MTLRIKPTRHADKQIRDESRWWRQNRTKTPALFRDELRRVFELIGEYPEAGPIAEDVDLIDVRRILMAGTQHYLYYRPNYEENRIEVLGVWSTSRGEPPRL